MITNHHEDTVWLRRPLNKLQCSRPRAHDQEPTTEQPGKPAFTPTIMLPVQISGFHFEQILSARKGISEVDVPT